MFGAAYFGNSYFGPNFWGNGTEISGVDINLWGRRRHGPTDEELDEEDLIFILKAIAPYLVDL